MNCKKKIKPQNLEEKQRKKDVHNNLYVLFDSRERALDAFKIKIFPLKTEGTGFPDVARVAKISDHKRDKVSDHSNLKILSPKQMLQRLAIALAQAKVSNTSKNLLNKIRQIIHSLYQAKEITKKVYNNIMNSIKL